MHVQAIQIKNLRSLRKVEWSLPADRTAGWHVLIGDNGSGKTTFLRGIALCLLGLEDILALRQDWRGWLQDEVQFAQVCTGLTGHPGYDTPELTSEAHGNELYFGIGRVSEAYANPSWGAPFNLVDTFKRIENGWFSAGYGPFRRFTGGDRELDSIPTSNPRLAANLSLFGENVALHEALGWLQELRFKELESGSEGQLLRGIRTFLNSGTLLPYQVRLDRISSDGVVFVDANGCQVPVTELSDGYRSVLSLAFDLIRQMVRFFGSDRVFDPSDPTRVIVPGVVLIDEVDAHLHPSWQREIGYWFTTHFPRVQFIVTTHSPLICQAAERGSVFRLPRPGTDEVGEMVTGTDLDRLLYGNVLDAYGTELFGPRVEQSDTARNRQKRLAELNVKELRKGLSEEERREQESLRASQPTAAGTLATVSGDSEP